MGRKHEYPKDEGTFCLGICCWNKLDDISRVAAKIYIIVCLPRKFAAMVQLNQEI